MVTHNPELAEQYANRIVRLRDGVIVEDSNPYVIRHEDFENVKKHSSGKASMSFLTALSLSFNNLRTKLARTLLTSFAGSIGIIGIAAILALSSGVNNYINDIQKQTMNSYPLTISAQTMDTSLMEQQEQEAMMMMAQQGMETPVYNGIYASYMTIEASSMMNSVLKENDLKSFKQYLDNPNSEIRQYLGENGVVYSYNMTFDVFSYDSNGNLVSSDADISAATELNSAMTNMGFDMGQMTEMFKSFYTSIVGTTSTGANNFSELLPGSNGEAVSPSVKDSYDLLYGSWPENYDEIVLVLDYTNSIDIGVLYQLGIITIDEYIEISDKIRNGETVEKKNWDYSTLCSHSFKLIPAADRYRANGNGTFSYINVTDEDFKPLIDKAINLKITGVIKPRLEADNATVITPVAYTSKLTDHLVSYAQTAPVVVAQQATPEINVLTGTSFEPASDEEKIAQVKEYLLSLSDAEKAGMYAVITMLTGSSTTTENNTTEDTESTAEEDKGFFAGLFEAIGLDGLFSDNSATDAFSNMGSMMSITDFLTGNGLDKWLEESADTKTLLYIYDEYLGNYSYDDNLDSFGCISYDNPDAISIYADNFENKEAISVCIENYNATVTEDSKIVYSDTIAMITDSITSIVDVVSYVLIAFVAVSLIVSSIMIGIITYISVLERTKEIGILRSIGASKRNISQVFNAETLIIGLCSGLIGILMTQLIIIPANSIIHALTNNNNVSAELPLVSAAVLIILSVALTLIGGLIPSKKASKKDPVTALRSE